ncbi:MAG: hypothetical protein CMH55_04600 [Myxococcales bacterium]|nr:hypothetical protein [Myxococcales bacterium]
MKLERLHLCRSVGLPEGLDAIVPGPGLNLILGANGSGKSSLTAGVLQALFHEIRDDQLVMNISLAGGVDLSHAHGKSHWNGPVPALPPTHFASSYRLGLLDLGEEGDSEADLVRRLKRELAGGYDLQCLSEGRRVKQSHGRKAWLERQRAEKERQRALNGYDELQRRQKGLVGLREELRLAEQGQGRLQDLGRAKQHCQRRGTITKDEGILAAAPSDWREIPLDAVEQVQSADEQLLAFDARRRELLIELESNGRETEALGLTAPLSEDELVAWRRRAKKLEGWEREQSDRHRRRATLQPAIVIEDQGQLLPNIDALEAKILQRSALMQDLQTLERQGGSEAPATAKLPESIHIGRELLAQWLQVVRPRQLPGWLLFVLALLLLMGMVVGLQGQWLGYGVAGIACLLLVWTQQEPKDSRDQLQRRYEDTGLPRPESWDPGAVGEAMERLNDQVAADDQARAEAQIRSQNEKARQQALQGLEELNGELAEIARSLGLPEDVSSMGLREAVEALKDRRDLEELEALIAVADDEADQLRSQALDALQSYGLSAPVDGHGLEAFVENLGNRCRECRHLHKERSQLEDRVAAHDRERIEIVARRDALLGGGDLVELAARVQVSKDAHEAEIRLVRDRQELAQLATQIEDPELLACDQELLAVFTRESEGALENMKVLMDQISKTEQAILQAREQAPLRQADQAFDAAQEALESEYDLGLDCLADTFLAQQLQADYESKSSPQLFGRVRRRLEAFTLGRYELEIQGSELRAIDHSGLGSQALSELSHGTRVQLLLAARLAFIEEHEDGVLLPLFLDEALSISDPERFEAVAKVLMDLVAEGRQVFYLSCDGADAHRWQRTAESLGQPAPEVIRLGKMASLVTYEEVPELQAPGRDESAEAYGRRIGVRDLDLWSPAESLDLFYLLEDRLDLVHRLRQAQQLQLGPYSLLRTRARNPAQLTDDDLRQLDLRVALFQDFLRLQRVGRGSPVRREMFEDERLKPSSRALLADLLDAVDGDAQALMLKVEQRQGDAFRRKQRNLAEVLAQILEEHGALDTRPVMDATERLGQLVDQHGQRVDLDVIAWLDGLWSHRIRGIEGEA